MAAWDFSEATPDHVAYAGGLTQVLRDTMDQCLEDFDHQKEAYLDSGSFDITAGLAAALAWSTLRIVEAAYDGPTIHALAPFGAALMSGEHRTEITSIFRASGFADQS